MGWLKSKRQIITSVDETREKLEPSYTADGNVKWRSHFGKQSGSPSNSYAQLPDNPAVPLLGIYSREMKTYVHTKLVHECS